MSVFSKIYVADTSAILHGTLREAVKDGKIVGKLLIHVYIVDYFDNLAKKGSSKGLNGLKELELLREAVEEVQELVQLEYTAEMPVGYRYRRDLDPDVIARAVAAEVDGVLVTSNDVLYRSAKAMGIEVLFLEVDREKEFILDKFFDRDTMSVHLKENVKPIAKKGLPGKWRFVVLREEPMRRDELEEIVRQILERAKSGSTSAFIESERPGSTIVQLENYRIVITRPPFSDGLEVTAVRPVAKLQLEDYRLPKKLVDRLERQAEGILIAGAPGMGKTTFAQALAEYYHRKGKIIKTIESPRDMHLPDEITQYSKNYATSEELHDVLLLSRPDYTFFDEMRDTKDFQLYADLRLAGVGMVGVVHATAPIDAIQRFIGRVELGMIPSIIDTVIFIRNGMVEKVYSLETTVKIPHGLREADLARPVVVVKDFLSGKPEYELYVFGERTFVVPIKKTGRAVAVKEYKVRSSLERALRRYVSDEEFDIDVDTDRSVVTISVPADIYNYVLGKPRKRLEKICKKHGFDLEIVPRI
ncbi:MAG: ATPase [Thermoprotei archaeon]|nr:MAG: ATPase [Thermoprotei archaeon]